MEHAIRRALSRYIDSDYIPGAVGLVAYNDELHVEVLGRKSFGQPAPMTRDTIFRIASITKPVVAAAVMILVEECKIRLDDPIDEWLPELANRRVLRELSSDLDDTVPANRAITVRDLLTFTFGIGSIMAEPGTYPIQARIREYRIGGDGPLLPTGYPRADEWLRNLASLPLIAQPGERWMYNTGSDLQGVLVERVSGKSLGRFMRERIFEPLGMKDTSFVLSRNDLDRLPTFYRVNHDTGAIEVFDGINDSAWLDDSAFEFGSGGLLSTIDDYYAFCRMMLNKGTAGKERVLSRSSVELMTSDQLTPSQREDTDIFFGPPGNWYASWGFGVGIDLKRDQIYRRIGRYGWDGGFGTSAYVDAVEGVIGIMFTQRMVDSPQAGKLYTDFWTAVYAALE